MTKHINNSRIIGIGEATHGQLKLNEWRIKLFKRLVKKHNFNVLVLEEQYSYAKILDKYVKNKINTYTYGINALPFLNTTFVKLIKWMRNYNKNNNNILSVIGIDCQYICPKYKSYSNTTKYVTNLVQKYNKNPKMNIRDKYMFMIFMRQYSKNKKYVVFGHNGHLQRTKYYAKDNRIWFGNYLSKKFGNKYFAIGNTFYNGSYLAKDIDNDYKISIARIKTKQELKDGFYVTNQIINNVNVYEGSMIFSSKDPNETYYKIPVGNRFDAIIVINKEIPFNLIVS